VKSSTEAFAKGFLITFPQIQHQWICGWVSLFSWCGVGCVCIWW